MGTIRGKKRELTFWGTVAGLLPFAYASSFAAIGPTTAEGCSGAAGEWREGITRLWSFETETHVARDGFYPFRATAANMKQADVLARITVEVRGADGELVPGETVVISVTNHDEYGANLVLGWSATGVTRADGEELAFHATGTNSEATVIFDESLTVVDVEPELTLPSFEVTDWTRVKYDAGNSVSCGDEFGGDCEDHEFGEVLRDAQRMTLGADGVTPPVLVVWEYELAAVAGKGVLVEGPDAFGPQSGYSQELSFRAGSDEYCVRVRGRDLRSGTTKEEELCSSPSNDSDEVTYDSIGSCSEPPAGYLERWCHAVERVGDPLGDHAEACEQYLSPSAGAGGASGQDTGSGGTPDPGAGGTGSGAKGGGTSKGGTAGATEPEPTTDAGPPPAEGSAGSPDSPKDDEAGDTGSGARTVLTEGGCGCRTAAGGTGRDGALAGSGLLALALGFGLRRRQRDAE